MRAPIESLGVGVGGHRYAIVEGLERKGVGDGVCVDAAVELVPGSMTAKGGERGRPRSDGWGFQ
jgi:hypothetical protein